MFIFIQAKEAVMDILFTGIIVVLFLISWLFMKLVARV